MATWIDVNDIFILMHIFALELRFHRDILRHLINKHSSTWQTACKQQCSF